MVETGPRSQRASGRAGLAAYFYWLQAPSEWLRPCHHLGHCPLSACLGEQGFRAEQWGARPGALNYRVRLSTAATGHTTHQMTHSETLQRGLRETSDCGKENSSLSQRQKGKWVGPKRTAGRHFHTRCFPSCDRGNPEGGCLCHPKVHQLLPWEAGQCAVGQRQQCVSPPPHPMLHRMFPGRFALPVPTLVWRRPGCPSSRRLERT